MFRYLLLLAVFTLGVSLLILGLSWFASALLSSRYILPVSIYFFTVTALLHYGMMRSSAGRPAVFIRFFMGATTLKLFLHFGILVVFAFLNKDQLFPFAITFLTYYLLFTAFEVMVAFKKNAPAS